MLLIISLALLIIGIVMDNTILTILGITSGFIFLIWKIWDYYKIIVNVVNYSSNDNVKGSILAIENNSRWRGIYNVSYVKNQFKKHENYNECKIIRSMNDHINDFTKYPHIPARLHKYCVFNNATMEECLLANIEIEYDLYILFFWKRTKTKKVRIILQSPAVPKMPKDIQKQLIGSKKEERAISIYQYIFGRKQ